jgi:aspartate/methionine/tyrosine aminotransferase
MLYKRMPIEKESPEEMGYNNIACNLAESSVTDIQFGELNLLLNHLKLEYVAHRGHTALRRMIAAEAGLSSADQVLLTNGAAGALFIINSSLLNPTDHLVVVQPNYATNIEVPLTIGCAISYITLQFEQQWRLNTADVEAALLPNTKLISITTPHNPTGMLMNKKELTTLAEIAQTHGIPLLVDETYRNTGFETPYPVLASTGTQIISVSSLSKAFGLPGLRIGWLMTQDAQMMERFLAAKEMIYISNSALDEEVAYQFYRQRAMYAPGINAKARKNYDLLTAWLAKENRLECILPMGGVVCFPRFRCGIRIDTEKFYRVLLQQYKTIVAPGHWFAMPDEYMRIGFGWADNETFATGLHNISRSIDAAIA